jgi:hypothetical protein
MPPIESNTPTYPDLGDQVALARRIRAGDRVVRARAGRGADLASCCAHAHRHRSSRQELSAEKTGGGWRVELAGRVVEAAYLDQAIAELLGVRSGEAVPWR